MWPRTLLFLMAFVVLSGCRQKLVVYADPWMKAFATEAVQEFEKENTGVEIELKIISSEVIASHIRFGQPIDIFLCFNPGIVENVGIADAVGASKVLAGEKMVVVKSRDQGKFAQFQTQGCLVREASQRPGRVFGDPLEAQFMKAQPGTCLLTADFQQQMEDYLLRGWIPTGIVPFSFASGHPQELQILTEGERIPGAYTAFLTSKGGQNKNAEAFFQFLVGKKSAEMLARHRLFP